MDKRIKTQEAGIIKASLEFYENIFPKPWIPSREFIFSTVTYGDIYELALGIKELTSSNANQEEPVCLFTENKAVILASLLASLAGGAKFVLPYAFSERVFHEMHEAVGFTKVLSDQQIDFIPGLEQIKPQKCLNPEQRLQFSRDPDATFLKLFTGGSTGKPKIWSKTPRNLFSEASYLSGRFGISKDDLFISTVPPYHIYGLLFSVLTPFLSSARVLDDVYTFPQEILTLIKNYPVTVLVSVPMHYRVLRLEKPVNHSLRLAFSSAGALDEGDAEAFYRNTGLGIMEIYGSTETGGIATRCLANNESSWTPFDVVQWKLGHDRLHVRSEFISLEAPKDDFGFFMTGDRADYDLDTGDKFILGGRIDGIVKVAGKRVDLMEIEGKLKKISGIKDAVVVALPVRSGRENEIAALVVSDLNEIELRRSMAKTQEPYALPRRLRIVDEIPRTSAGKYDRQAIEQLFL